MAVKKTGGDEYEAKRKPGAGKVAAGSDNGSIPSVSGVPSFSSREEAASIIFRSLLQRTDGWLRCIPCGEGKVNYFKWKFTNGPHTGKYVMYVGEYDDWAGSISGLAQKLHDVDDGIRRPAYDTYYDPR